MKLDLAALLVDAAGLPVDVGGTHFTLQRACQHALGATLAGDEALDTHAKLQLYEAALKVEAGGEQEFSAEQIALLKRRIGACYHFITVGRCFALLDPKA